LKGKIAGIITFHNEKIIVNNENILFDEIVTLDFLFSDYYGKYEPNYNKSFNAILSQGVDNYFTYTDASADSFMVNFRLKSKEDHLRLVPFINDAIKAGKISLDRAQNIFGGKNYFE
jgi:hypothetical protein